MYYYCTYGCLEVLLLQTSFKVSKPVKYKEDRNLAIHIEHCNIMFIIIVSINVQ